MSQEFDHKVIVRICQIEDDLKNYAIKLLSGSVFLTVIGFFNIMLGMSMDGQVGPVASVIHALVGVSLILHSMWEVCNTLDTFERFIN